MKKTSPEADELLPEYDFDYTEAKLNRFASGKPKRTVAVLDQDLSRVFTTPESVNNTLRTLIKAMPSKSEKM